MHLQGPEQAGLLLLIKQILTKYPTAKSSLIEMDDEGLHNSFLGSFGLYKPDLNDPQLSNASQSSIIFELTTTLSYHRNRGLFYDASAKLARSILYNEALPQEYLGLSGVEAVKGMYKQELDRWNMGASAPAKR